MALINCREDAFRLFHAKCVMNEETGCWEWTGSIDENGYGNLTWRTDGTQINKAHRVAYGAFRAHPGKLHVLHTCDNRACCNVSHMFLGTNSDNVQDKVAKGRQARGSGHACAKMAEEEVLEIRQMFADGYTRKEIAFVFDELSYRAIANIIQRTNWTHI